MYYRVWNKILFHCQVFVLTSTLPELLGWFPVFPSIGPDKFVHLQLLLSGISCSVQDIEQWHTQLVWFSTFTFLISRLVMLANSRLISCFEPAMHFLWLGGNLGSHVPEQRCTLIWWGRKPDCWTGITVALGKHNCSSRRLEDTITEYKKKFIEWMIRNQLSLCIIFLLASPFCTISNCRCAI